MFFANMINIVEVKTSNNKRAHSRRMKSGTILFSSSFASIKGSIRAHSVIIIHEIIASLEECFLFSPPKCL